MRHNEKKLKEIKTVLINALNEMPDEFSLSKSKSYLRQTIQSLTEVESKREKRKLQQQINEIPKNPVFFGNIEDAKNALIQLDKMLKAEEQKISTNQEPPPKLMSE